MTNPMVPPFINFACEIISPMTPILFKNMKLGFKLSEEEEQKIETAINLIQSRYSNQKDLQMFLICLGYKRFKNIHTPLDKLLVLGFLTSKFNIFSNYSFEKFYSQLPESFSTIPILQLKKDINFMDLDFPQNNNNQFQYNQITKKIGSIRHMYKRLECLENCNLKLIKSINKEVEYFNNNNNLSMDINSFLGINIPNYRNSSHDVQSGFEKLNEDGKLLKKMLNKIDSDKTMEAQFLEWIYKSEKESSALFDTTNDDIGIPIKKDLLASAEVILELEEYIYEALIRGELDLNSLPKILSENKGKISNLNLNDNFDSISIKSPDFFNGEPIDAIQNDINIFHQKNTATLKKLLQICEPHIPFEHSV